MSQCKWKCWKCFLIFLKLNKVKQKTFTLTSHPFQRFYKHTRIYTGIQPRPLDLSLKSWVTKRTGICVWICAHMYICACMYVCVFITVFSLSSSVPANSLSYWRGWLGGKGHVLHHRCICNPLSLLSGVSTSNIGLLSSGGAFEGSLTTSPLSTNIL